MGTLMHRVWEGFLVLPWYQELAGLGLMLLLQACYLQQEGQGWKREQGKAVAAVGKPWLEVARLPAGPSWLVGSGS